jgi:hypothetical protein
MPRATQLRGIIALILALGLFIASDMASKFVFAHVPVFEVVMLRAAGAGLWPDASPTVKFRFTESQDGKGSLT